MLIVTGGQIVLVQYLVSSLSLGDCSVHRLREDVSSTIMLIVRRTNCIRTASGIVTLETSEWFKLLKYIVFLYYISIRKC